MNAPASILMIDDDEADVFAIKRALSKSELSASFSSVSSGQNFLEEYRDTHDSKPDLILLDINMPGIGGLELLQELKNDGDWKDTPVVMLTTSDQQSDRDQSMSAGALSYLTKPSSQSEMQSILSTITRHLGKILN